MFHPSSDTTCASYQATGPSQGWCEFTLRRVTPSVAREPRTAWAFEPGKRSLAFFSSATTTSPTWRGLSSPSADITRGRPSMSGSLCTNPAAMSLPRIGKRRPSASRGWR